MSKDQSEERTLSARLGITSKQILYLLIADIGYALALNLFYVGNNIAAGGLAGIGTVLNYFFSWPIGLTVLVLTVPIVVLGAKIKGKAYVIMALITTAVYSLIVDLLSFLPCITEDKIVAVVFGGILYGASSALVVKARLSTGGTDLLAKIIITKAKTLSIGTLYMLIDGTIVAAAMIAYRNVSAGIYALMAIAVCSIVTDKLTSGFNRAQMFYIFAGQNSDKITEAILNEMHRGVTAISGTGKFSNSAREILLTVVKPNETPILKALVHKLDPAAFVVLVSANEIIGNGFEDINLTETIND
ncbi:MAG: YitT family protein [Candidatus Fimisoma sp.]|nr:YitT family protein [Bacillota bacterium]MDY4747519.1 YitT family protein [Candidatus Fimisoma sp.]